MHSQYNPPVNEDQAENTEPKFTPGPWRVDIASDNLFSILSPGDGYNEICVLWKYAGAIEDPLLNDTHNAHLIAAAPDMYEALKPFAPYAEKAFEVEPEDCVILLNFRGVEITYGDLKAARSVLLKARGGK